MPDLAQPGADRATTPSTWAEEVIYFVQGRDVRHPGESGQARSGPA